MVLTFKTDLQNLDKILFIHLRHIYIVSLNETCLNKSILNNSFLKYIKRDLDIDLDLQGQGHSAIMHFSEHVSKTVSCRELT